MLAKFQVQFDNKSNFQKNYMANLFANNYKKPKLLFSKLFDVYFQIDKQMFVFAKKSKIYNSKAIVPTKSTFLFLRKKKNVAWNLYFAGFDAKDVD